MNIKNLNLYNNKNYYASIKELTTHLLKRNDFYNQIKILYPLWGVQPNLENQKSVESLKAFHSIELIQPITIIIIVLTYEYSSIWAMG